MFLNANYPKAIEVVKLILKIARLSDSAHILKLLLFLADFLVRIQ